jgi:hypothetical protein
VAVRPTSVRLLLLWAFVAGVLGWMFAAWVDDQGHLPQVPWLSVVVIWVVALFVLVWTLVARRRLHPEPGKPRMAPLVAARTAALSLAGSRTGALVFGGYGGMALRLLEETAVAAGRERLLAASLAAFGGLALAAASLWLEHICRLPEDPANRTSAKA